ncbi:MAG UNVERIFIED_CONTAM: hypothetical protein LVR18_40110 [Planctomycetaceae bacterium]
MAKLRLDGFCSLQTAGDARRRGCCHVAKPAVFPRVTINARTKPEVSVILAEIVDRRGRVVRGFGREGLSGFSGRFGAS